MHENIQLVREVTIDQAVEYFIPTEDVDPKFLFQYQQRHNALHMDIVNFCTSRSGGTLWIYKTSDWNPPALIGGEGLAYARTRMPPELLHIVNY